jgi:chemotaxis protein MotA
MDIATFLGLVTGLAMIVAAMLSAGDNHAWLHLPSLFITIGGTLSAVLIHFPAKRVRTAFAVARTCFVTSLPEASEVVSRFREIATQVRREGTGALEKEAAKESDSFMKLGLEMASNESDATFVREALQRELIAIEHRHLQGRRLFEVMASAAPAWGMTGTLIGLVQMLRSFDDPRTLGSGLALALLTTLYGALFSNLLCVPLAGKLEARHAEEVLIRQVMTDGFVALIEENSPNIVEERLRAWVPPRERTTKPDEKNRAA